MTTANLSVGLDTSPALARLKAFKEEARTEMRGFKIAAEIDFEGSVKEAMKKQPRFGLDIYVNESKISGQVRGAITEALRGAFEVKINSEMITAQVLAAVQKGMVGGNLNLSTTGAPAVNNGSPALDMKAITTQVGVAVADAVANQVGKAVQKINTQKGGPTGSVGFSATDPNTGMRTSVKETVDADLAMQETQRLLEIKRQVDAAKAGMREEGELRKSRLTRAQQENAAWDAYYAQTAKERDSAFDRAEKDTRKKISEDQTRALKDQIRERREADRQGNTSANNYFAAERKIQDELKQASAEKLKADKEANSEFDAIRQARLRKEKEQDAAWSAYRAGDVKAKDDAFDRSERDTRKKISEDQTRALKDQIRARLDAEKQGNLSAQNYFAAERKIQDELLGAQRESQAARRAAFGRGRSSAADDRVSRTEQQQGDKSRNSAFDALEAAQAKARSDEMNKVWAEQDRQRQDKVKKDADMERLAGVAAATRNKQIQDEVKLFRDAEAEKEALQKAAATRSKTLVGEAQRVANDTWQSIKNMRRSEETDTVKNVRYANPGQVNEIKRLEGQIRTLVEAESLVGKSGAGLAIRKYGSDAVEQIPKIEALRQKLKQLRDAADAAGSGPKGPSQGELLRRQMANVKATAEMQARSQGNLTPTGVRVAGAEALVNKFGRDTSAAFLNNDGLMSQVGRLDNHRVAIKASTEAVADQSSKVNTTAAAYRRWKENMNDVHSGARGLAGSLGMLWVTWGNTAPIVAAAALGASMRSVFMVGKDLEYQLRFVSILANDAAIPLQKFGDTVRGSLILPTEAAQALRGLAQNGLSVREAFQALPAILNLATAGEMELMEAALGATGVMAAFNLQVSDLGRVGDVFAKAAALSNTSVTSMVESMKQASTVSDKYKVSLEETAATLAVMAKRNIIGSAAGTAFRNMMVELATPIDRAKRSMEAVGLQLFDTSGQLRSYGDVLTQLRAKTVLMNEQGRLTFLNELFGERGAKAANSLLSDFDLYNETLNELKNNAKDFSATVAKALQDTTQGKMKSMLTEFQLATTETFFKANKDINYFIDSLRAVARSQEFQQFLSATAKGVTELTGFLIEHGKTVGLTILTWMGFRVLDGVVSGLLALRGAMVAAGVAAGGLRLALLGVMGAATGGIALVAALAAEFIFLRKNTYESVEEQKKFNLQLDMVADGLNRELKALQDSNAGLARRNQLLREGKTAGEIDKILDGESERRKGTDFKKKTEESKANLAEQQRVVMAYEEWQKQVGKSGPRSLGDPILQSPVSAKQYDYAKSIIPELQRTVDTNQRAELDFVNIRMEKLFQDNEQTNVKRRTEIQAFNRRLADIDKESKGAINTKDLVLSTDLVRFNKDEDYNAAIAKANEALNLRLRKFEAPNAQGAGSAAAAARALDKSEARSVIAQMNRERQDLEQQIANSRKINNSIFDEKSLGAETLALIENVRARRESEKVLEAEGRWRTKFKELLAPGNLKNLQPEDVQQYQDALAELEAKASRMRKDLAVNDQVAQNTAIRKEREAAIERGRTLDELRAKGIQVAEDLKRASEKKYIDPEQAVRDNATAKIDDVYASEILEAKKQVSATQERLAALQEDTTELSGQELAQQVETMLSLRAQLSTREAILLAMQSARDQQKGEVGQGAVDEYNRSLTADAGFSRFWGEYREQGRNSADFVYNAMKTSTDNMGRAFEQFGATGKISSRSMINAIISDLGRLAAQSIWRQVVGMVIGSFGAPGPGNIGAPDISSIAFAKGGVMTSHGNLPLRQYAAGGVAHSAQVAVFGEGRKPEAYVPLEDGRTIPVTVDGGGSTGGVVSLTFSPNITIDSRSDQAQVGAIVQRALKSYHVELMDKLKEKGVTA